MSVRLDSHTHSLITRTTQPNSGRYPEPVGFKNQLGKLTVPLLPSHGLKLENYDLRASKNFIIPFFIERNSLDKF